MATSTERKSEELLSFGFNQDFSCVSVGTKTGYKIFSCNPFQQCHAEARGGIGIVEMLYCTSLVALVGAGEQPTFSPRRLIVWNTAESKCICELNFLTSILSVRLNRRRLVVVLENKVHIFDLNSMKLLHVMDTAANPKGLCALSSAVENNFLAFPASNTTGDLFLFDTSNLHALNVIQAHQNLLSAFQFNTTGTLLATSSEKGTVIRVFSVPQGEKLYSFRRGSYPASVYSMAFSLDSALLCVSSDTGTIHVFKLESASTTQDNSLLGSATSIVRSYLPSYATDIVEPNRDFACVRLRNARVKNVCALNKNNTKVMVVTADGYFYQYTLDTVNGGDCRLEGENLLLETESDELNVAFF
eukprot:GILK01006657.1.p1 GENE.GILK01006657.1~~GILK01006657.1.p1  ORF type:complete len:397 (-),score=34.65 GILK01006657.1:89-1165(-)